MMDLDEIRSVLAVAVELRSPVFEERPDGRRTDGREKVNAIEDYFLEIARHRGALEEALHWLIELQTRLRRDWEGIEGWQNSLSQAEARSPTKDQLARAKRTVRPDLWDAQAEAKRLLESVHRQIRRLEIDDRAMSRVYTFISGS